MHEPLSIMQLAGILRGFKATFSWYHDFWIPSIRELTTDIKSEKQLLVLNSVSYPERGFVDGQSGGEPGGLRAPAHPLCQQKCVSVSSEMGASHCRLTAFRNIPCWWDRRKLPALMQRELTKVWKSTQWLRVALSYREKGWQKEKLTK